MFAIVELCSPTELNKSASIISRLLSLIKLLPYINMSSGTTTSGELELFEWLAQKPARSGSASTAKSMVSGALPSLLTSIVKLLLVPANICWSGPFELLNASEDE